MRAPSSAPRRLRYLVLTALAGLILWGPRPASAAAPVSEPLSEPPRERDEPWDEPPRDRPGDEEPAPPGDERPVPTAVGALPEGHEAILSRAAFSTSAFGPSYFVEGIQILTVAKTEPALILALLDIRPGEVLQANDARVDLARLRLIASGLFLNARLSLRRGARPGGVILQLELEERGTFILDDVFLGTSRATAFWAGGSVTETNIAGKGLSVGAAFVASTTPDVRGADAGLAGQLRVAFPAFLTGGYGLSASLTFSTGSEFFRDQGSDTSSDPAGFMARDVRRLGARLGATRDMPHNFRVYLGVRAEAITTDEPSTTTRTLPDGETHPIDFHLLPDFSRLTALALSVSHDTRPDPVMPRAGHLVALGNETATGLFGSYTYSKMTLTGSQFFGLPRGHALGLHVFAGGIFGSAPQFDRFFVGDLDELLAPRALGLNFSTQTPPNLGSGIARHRYDDFATRLSGEYVVPLWRRHGWIYGGYGFLTLGVFGMVSRREDTPAIGSTWSTWPLGFTGDVGLRLDTAIGLFRLSIGNLLGRVSF